MEIQIAPEELVAGILENFGGERLYVLDSCNTSHRASQMLYGGVAPAEVLELYGSPEESLRVLDEVLTADKPSVFTLSYDLGRKLKGISDRVMPDEPDVFIARFGSLIAYDYATGEFSVVGKTGRRELSYRIFDAPGRRAAEASPSQVAPRSNFTRSRYLAAIEEIKDRIRRGDTYQTNLTQKITVELPPELSAADVFRRLRQKHPAPFSAYIERRGSAVVSASPERFFRVIGDRIEAAPIKGTSSRGQTPAEDRSHRTALLASEKDRAENIMIVDLMRNDLGRVCEYGSVTVSELCAVQELPTMFHLESKVAGQLRSNVRPSDILKALFPCGSITGAPKLRTMQIIDELEPDKRGLSMGAIGLYIPDGLGLPPVLDLSVAIRTMVICDSRATFNVGGGIVIDSDPEAEYEESLLKATALLDALGTNGDELAE